MSRKQQVQPIEPDFRFSDRTILEADGEYEWAKKLARRYQMTEPWMLLTDLTLIHQFGISEMELEFFNDGRVIIKSFTPSHADPQANFDMRYLRAWTDQNGWKIAQPSQFVVKERVAFWKFMWETRLIDSPYLDERYGCRPDLYAIPEVEVSSESSEESDDDPVSILS